MSPAIDDILGAVRRPPSPAPTPFIDICRPRPGADWHGRIGRGDCVEEAPADGRLFGRQDRSWSVIDLSGDWVDAPADGQLYGRQNNAWVAVRIDGGTY